MRFIDGFEVILLDLMDTFMFGGDCFSDVEDYARTYRALGGRKLSDAQVQAAISQVFGRILVDYENPAFYERLPPVRSYLEIVLNEARLSSSEVGLLDAVFAAHETGKIPDSHAEVVRQLRRTHRLGVVCNLWCEPGLCRDEFRRTGIEGLFETIVFSSDLGIVKPSPLIFREALKVFGVEASRVVFVGDDLARDIGGAKACGMAAVWIDRGRSTIDEMAARPDLVIKDLRELTGAHAS
jgi:FMN phosphatase YigB (HAD superfamily)